MSHTDEQLELCKEKWKQFDQHAQESVGVRDRLMKAEMAIERLKVDVKNNAIIGGLIGALIGSGSAPAISGLVNLFFKGGM